MTFWRIFIFKLLFSLLFVLSDAEPVCDPELKNRPPLIRLDRTPELCQCEMEQNEALGRIFNGEDVDEKSFSFVGILYTRTIFDDVDKNSLHYDDFDYWYKPLCTVSVIEFFN